MAPLLRLWRNTVVFRKHLQEYTLNKFYSDLNISTPTKLCTETWKGTIFWWPWRELSNWRTLVLQYCTKEQKSLQKILERMLTLGLLIGVCFPTKKNCFQATTLNFFFSKVAPEVIQLIDSSPASDIWCLQIESFHLLKLTKYKNAGVSDVQLLKCWQEILLIMNSTKWECAWGWYKTSILLSLPDWVKSS